MTTPAFKGAAYTMAGYSTRKKLCKKSNLKTGRKLTPAPPPPSNCWPRYALDTECTFEKRRPNCYHRRDLLHFLPPPTLQPLLLFLLLFLFLLHDVLELSSLLLTSSQLLFLICQQSPKSRTRTRRKAQTSHCCKASKSRALPTILLWLRVQCSWVPWSYC